MDDVLNLQQKAFNEFVASWEAGNPNIYIQIPTQRVCRSAMAAAWEAGIHFAKEHPEESE